MKLIKKVKKLLYKIKYKKFGTPDGGKQWGGGGGYKCKQCQKKKK